MLTPLFCHSANLQTIAQHEAKCEGIPFTLLLHDYRTPTEAGMFHPCFQWIAGVIANYRRHKRK